jgi:uncharacterized protein (TIGR02757 family)
MITTSELEELYRRYNRKRYVHPDPLEFLYRYPAVGDREVAGLIAASLAYGRVAQILKSVEAVLSRMGRSPAGFLQQSSERRLATTFRGFKHRFTTDTELVSLLCGIKRVIAEHGSLNSCFVAGLKHDDETILPALAGFACALGCCGKYLIPVPESGSACKRLNLFLRWMVRKDAVDPGGWKGVPREKLIVPLDTHMATIGCSLGMTRRRTPDIRMALDITGWFRKRQPADPVKYDFALTRFGIRADMKMSDLIGKAERVRLNLI